MFKKLFIAMLILGFVGTVSVTAQEIRIPTIEKADLSSKNATIRTFFLAALNNKPEILLECYSPKIREDMKKMAKENKMSLSEVMAKVCQNMQKVFKPQLEKDYKGNLEKMMEDITAKNPPPLINVNGKWYIDIK
jgi:hypothetical protein